MLTMTSVCTKDEYEVIVVGGGPSGCAAATAAARQGVRTLLVESSAALGGMGTIGLVTAWAPFSDGEKIVYRGLAQEILEKSKAVTYGVDKNAVDWVAISPEDLKRVYDDLVSESGANILFNSLACGAEVNQGKIEAIGLANKCGLSEYKAQIFIDCTGDADIAAYAGVPFAKGDSDGRLQPATLCFIITNVNMKEYKKTQLNGGDATAPIHAILKSGRYPIIPDAHFCVDTIGPDTIGFNAGHLWDSDGVDVQQVSKSLIAGRKLAWAIRNALVEFSPGAFRESYLVATASALGIRESRRIQGEYILTLDDYANRRNFPDEIARNCYCIDIHPATKEIAASGREDSQPNILPYGKGESHGIPFRCLIPKGIDNLLVAGRAISCDRTVMGSTRVMPNCLTTGEAAGIAASLAVKNGTGVRGINVQELRQILKKNGAYIL